MKSYLSIIGTGILAFAIVTTIISIKASDIYKANNTERVSIEEVYNA